MSIVIKTGGKDGIEEKYEWYLKKWAAHFQLLSENWEAHWSQMKIAESNRKHGKGLI
jgi:hypothetical protein